MDIYYEIKLYNSIKAGYRAAVKQHQVSDAESTLRWLRSRLTEEQLSPDTELGFLAIEDELAFAKRMLNEQPSLCESIKRAAERPDAPQTDRLINKLLKNSRSSRNNSGNSLEKGAEDNAV